MPVEFHPCYSRVMGYLSTSKRTDRDTNGAVAAFHAGRPVDPLAPGNYRHISRQSGLSPQHVARVIKGTKGASFHVAARIAEGAGVTLDELYRHIRRSRSLKVKGRRTVADIKRYASDSVRKSLKRNTKARKSAARI